MRVVRAMVTSAIAPRVGYGAVGRQATRPPGRTKAAGRDTLQRPALLIATRGAGIRGVMINHYPIRGKALAVIHPCSPLHPPWYLQAYTATPLTCAPSTAAEHLGLRCYPQL